MTKMEEIEEEDYTARIDMVAEVLNAAFHAEDAEKTCYVLMLTEFGDACPRVTYVSNGEREDIINLMKEVLNKLTRETERSGTA
jgi:hypothetical protein